MILSCWRRKSLAALVLEQPTELAGLPAGLIQWQRSTDKSPKKKTSALALALVHTLTSYMLFFFGGLLEAQNNMRFEGFEEARFNLIRQSSLHMALEYRAGEQFLAKYCRNGK
jgi:hypothetical protein